MEPKGKIKEQADGSFTVWAEDKKSGYIGPYAHVYTDREWLVISTDYYEGTAMMNIETLPLLQKALRNLSKKIKSTQHPNT